MKHRMIEPPGRVQFGGEALVKDSDARETGPKMLAAA
jgi:hypothetical protein